MTILEISVIMLTYNREKLVGRAIESILGQTLGDFEFIIVDNGSTDGSGAVAEKYAKKDPRIRVIRRERGNIGSGRNAGLDMARGEYVAFIDDDDWAEPDFLEFLHGLATQNDADVAICGAQDRVFDEKRVMTGEQAVLELMWRKRYNVAFPTKLFTKELKTRLRFPEDDKYDDISQMHRLLANAGRVAYHGLMKYTFYRHEGNNSAWTTNHALLNPDTLDEYLRTYRERTRWLCGRFPKNKPAWRYFEWSFMISMVEKIHRYKIADCEKQLEYMANVLARHREAIDKSVYVKEFEKAWLHKYIRQFEGPRPRREKAEIQCAAEEARPEST